MFTICKYISLTTIFINFIKLYIYFIYFNSTFLFISICTLFQNKTKMALTHCTVCIILQFPLCDLFVMCARSHPIHSVNTHWNMKQKSTWTPISKTTVDKLVAMMLAVAIIMQLDLANHHRTPIQMHLHDHHRKIHNHNTIITIAIIIAIIIKRVARVPDMVTIIVSKTRILRGEYF